MATKLNSANAIARQIMDIVPHAMRAMKSEMRQSRASMMPGHFRLLGMLSHRCWTLKELADRQGVSAPTMSNTITTLEERGWLTRTRSAEDRRAVVIQVTEEGKRTLEEAHRHAESHLAALLEPLDDAEREALAQGLKVLYRVFESAHVGDAESDFPHNDCQHDPGDSGP